MLALQIVLCVSTVLGLLASYLEFKRATTAYTMWREGSENGLGLQVAAGAVRVGVLFVASHVLQVVIMALVLAVMWLHLFQWDLVLIQLTGLSMLALLTTLKQLIIRYDYALVMDAAVVKMRMKT